MGEVPTDRATAVFEAASDRDSARVRERAGPGGDLYIGHPSRHLDIPAGEFTVRTVEDLRYRAESNALRRRRTRRRKRSAAVSMSALLLGAAIGWASGRLSRTTPAEMAADELEAVREDKADRLVDRVLRELWRMEAAERSPSVGGR